MTTLHDFHVTAIDGSDVDLARYAGKVVLVVNTASKCGLTPQFEGLQAMYDELEAEGLVVLGFPCSQFAQELDDIEEIGAFCSQNYGVTFPMFDKINVNGRHVDPLFKWLKKSKRGPLGSVIEWNFTKFLVGRDGVPIARFSSHTEPANFADEVRSAVRGI